jgi:hypothetical protein
VLWRHCGNQKQGRHILVSTWTFLSLASLHWRRICWVLAVELVKVWTLSTHAAKATAFANLCGLLQAEVCCSSGLIILLCYHLFVCLHNAICRFAPKQSAFPSLLLSTTKFILLTRSCSLVSFSQLQKQIIDLATTHFVHLPVRPPAEDLAQVPSNLPSFLGDTIASRYVHVVFNSLWLHLMLS